MGMGCEGSSFLGEEDTVSGGTELDKVKVLAEFCGLVIIGDDVIGGGLLVSRNNSSTSQWNPFHDANALEEVKAVIREKYRHLLLTFTVSYVSALVSINGVHITSACDDGDTEADSIYQVVVLKERKG